MALIEAIILAGGLGTRLRTVLPDLPKPLAPIAGKPFLHYLLSYLSHQSLQRLIFAVGYKAEAIQSWLQGQSWPFQIELAIETTPLGTGGAIQNAWPLTTTPHVLVLNGDTFCPAPLSEFYHAHLQKEADISLISVAVSPADRYGTLQISPEGWVQAFHEKQPRPTGWINAGLYLIRRLWWEKQAFPPAFSWETYLQNALQSPHPPKIYAHQLSSLPFIDIGIPEDYERAQTYLPAHF
jgi:D-glycero-alpha-D-manno-heptose 1-phosphate guanylyltransferase